MESWTWTIGKQSVRVYNMVAAAVVRFRFSCLPEPNPIPTTLWSRSSVHVLIPPSSSLHSLLNHSFTALNHHASWPLSLRGPFRPFSAIRLYDSKQMNPPRRRKWRSKLPRCDIIIQKASAWCSPPLRRPSLPSVLIRSPGLRAVGAPPNGWGRRRSPGVSRPEGRLLCRPRDWFRPRQPFFPAITKAPQTVWSFTFECVWPISSVAIVTASPLSASVLHLKIKSNWAQMKQLATVLPSQSSRRCSRQLLGLLGCVTHFCRFSHIIIIVFFFFRGLKCWSSSHIIKAQSFSLVPLNRIDWTNLTWLVMTSPRRDVLYASQGPSQGNPAADWCGMSFPRPCSLPLCLCVV